MGNVWLFRNWKMTDYISEKAWLIWSAVCSPLKIVAEFWMCPIFSTNFLTKNLATVDESYVCVWPFVGFTLKRLTSKDTQTRHEFNMPQKDSFIDVMKKKLSNSNLLLASIVVSLLYAVKPYFFPWTDQCLLGVKHLATSSQKLIPGYIYWQIWLTDRLHVSLLTWREINRIN